MRTLFTTTAQRPPEGRAPSRRRHAALAILLAGLAGSAQAGRLGVFTSDERGFDTHSFYYDDGQEVVLIDTQFLPALSAAMLEQIGRETTSPVTRVLVTHPNPDKFNGLAYLHRQGIVSLSSAPVAAALPAVHAYKKAFWTNMGAFSDASYPAFEAVQQSFDGPVHTLRLKSGETLSLFALQHAGVAAHQMVVRVDASGDLIVGDLVHHKAHAWLEGGLEDGRPTPRIDEWLAALEELPPLAEGHPQARIHGGRGESAPVATAVQAQQTYLRRARELVQEYVSALGTRRAELADPHQAPAHHAALERRLAQAFPDYRLPYMVRYSVYGLLRQILEERPATPAALATPAEGSRT